MDEMERLTAPAQRLRSANVTGDQEPMKIEFLIAFPSLA
jgi:hypothetical protein